MLFADVPRARVTGGMVQSEYYSWWHRRNHGASHARVSAETSKAELGKDVMTFLGKLFR